MQKALRMSLTKAVSCLSAEDENWFLGARFFHTTSQEKLIRGKHVLGLGGVILFLLCGEKKTVPLPFLQKS